MKMIGVTSLALVLAGVGCAAAVPPAELVNARTAYDRAIHGPAAQLDPADLHSAKETLDRAERSFDDNGDAPETRDLAYTAARGVEIAEARARTRQDAEAKDQTVTQMRAMETAAAQVTSTALNHAMQRIETQGQQIQSDRERIEAAEKRAAQATAALIKLGAVKQETRGMVLTLSGSVLFVSGKADLLPTARARLNDVADVLNQDNSDVVVEGYTDSTGVASLNQDLSQRRAQTVRDYLVSRGVTPDRITAQGFGPDKPVADNASAEGRANNRRVEIVVHPPK
jgi:outer membrane protein OmpA-like peptidoglycan-associated protein